jgi:hypothetical protein
MVSMFQTNGILNACESVESGSAICRLCKQMHQSYPLIHMHKTTHIKGQIEASGSERQDFALNGNGGGWMGREF